MYECKTCGSVHEFGEIANLRGRKITRQEYEEMGAKAEVFVRCPDCNGRTFEKIRPERTRTVKSR